MPPQSTSKKTAGVSDAAVLKATGRTWDQWVKALNKAGAAEMEHKAIALLVHEKFGIDDWWAQMVTVGYEHAVGRREKHQKAGGYEISGNKTIHCPVETAFAAWEDARRRKRWLDEAITIRKATPHKSMRITWSDGKTSVSVNFYPKGDDKCAVQLQHGKLPDAEAAERMKAYWKTKLEALRAALEA